MIRTTAIIPAWRITVGNVSGIQSGQIRSAIPEKQIIASTIPMVISFRGVIAIARKADIRAIQRGDPQRSNHRNHIKAMRNMVGNCPLHHRSNKCIGNVVRGRIINERTRTWFPRKYRGRIARVILQKEERTRIDSRRYIQLITIGIIKAPGCSRVKGIGCIGSTTPHKNVRTIQ